MVVGLKRANQCVSVSDQNPIVTQCDYQPDDSLLSRAISPNVHTHTAPYGARAKRKSKSRLNVRVKINSLKKLQFHV